MNYLKIASAALAAFVMVGCSDKKGDCCGKSETCCEKKDAACCESVVAQTVSPRFTAQADAVALIEPQALVKTALKIIDEVKGGLPEEQVKEAEEYMAKVKKLGVEDPKLIGLRNVMPLFYTATEKYLANDKTVKDYMVPKPATVFRKTSISEVARIMIVNDFGQVPVHGTKDELVGMIYDVDVLRAIIGAVE